MKTTKPQLFIVVFDDLQGLAFPMYWDVDCDGAICSAWADKDSIAIFTSRSSARKAIDISAKWAALNKAQGKPANEDFLGECRKNIRIIPCEQR